MSIGATGVLALSSSLPITTRPPHRSTHGVDVLLLAGIDEGVAAAGAGAEQADLAVEVGLGRASTARRPRCRRPSGSRRCRRGAHLGGDVVRIAVAAAALALIEVGADRHVAVMREPPGRLDVKLAPSRADGE